MLTHALSIPTVFASAEAKKREPIFQEAVDKDHQKERMIHPGARKELQKARTHRSGRYLSVSTALSARN